jgi:hypothetical protein
MLFTTTGKMCYALHKFAWHTINLLNASKLQNH